MLEGLEQQLAKEIAPGLVGNVDAYTVELKRMAEAEPGMLVHVNKFAADVSNRGPLSAGTEVLVLHDGAACRARVEKVIDAETGQHELALFKR